MSVSLKDTDFQPVGGFDESFFGYNLVVDFICGHAARRCQNAADKQSSPTLTLLHPWRIGKDRSAKSHRAETLVVPADTVIAVVLSNHKFETSKPGDRFSGPSNSPVEVDGKSPSPT